MRRVISRGGRRPKTRGNRSTKFEPIAAALNLASIQEADEKSPVPVDFVLGSIPAALTVGSKLVSFKTQNSLRYDVAFHVHIEPVVVVLVEHAVLVGNAALLVQYDHREDQIERVCRVC